MPSIKIKIASAILTLSLFAGCFGALAQNNDSSYVIINDIILAGNKVTKEYIILLELLVQKGDTIPKGELNTYIKKSKESLLNTSLFNYITINVIPQYNSHINLFILVEERWYLWPYPILEHADRNLSSFLHEKDWSRINYGMMLVKNNFRGRNETLQLKLRLGYKEQYQIQYATPYLFRNKKHGLSTEFSYFRQKEIPYDTYYDKLVFHRDDDQYVKEYQDFNVSYFYRPRHFTRHGFMIGYYHANVQDTILQLNDYYFDDKRTNTQHLSLRYIFDHDKRDFKHYPLSGYNIQAQLAQTGLGILENGTKGIRSFQFEGYNYQKLADRWYSGYGGSFRLSSNRKQPYFIEGGLGYGQYLRSYEYNVIAGQNYFTTRSFIKYALIPRKVNYFETWSWNKFNKIHYSVYVNMYLESGYVFDIQKPPTNDLPNTLLLSGGIGVDIAAYYDQVYRFEYSANKQGQHGFFIHVRKAF